MDHRPRPTTVIAAVIVLLTLVATGCSGADVVTATTTTRADIAAPPPPAPVRLGVCIDWSGSIEMSARTATREAIEGLIRDWVPAAPGGADAQPAVAGLDLRVRRVLGDTLDGTDVRGEVLRGEISGIPPVIARPAATDDPKRPAHREQAAAAADARQRAETEATELSGELKEATLTATGSDIMGCLETIVRAHPGARVVLTTDLANREDTVDGVPPRVSGVANLDDVQILAAVACADRATCARRQATWSDALSTAGASITFVDPTELADRLPAFVHSTT